MNEAKLHDEMMESRKDSSGMVEAGLGEEDSKMMRRVVLKMDLRYAPTQTFIPLALYLFFFFFLLPFSEPT